MLSKSFTDYFECRICLNFIIGVQKYFMALLVSGPEVLHGTIGVRKYFMALLVSGSTSWHYWCLEVLHGTIGVRKYFMALFVRNVKYLSLLVVGITIIKVEVNEYQCAKCGYKWINRVNDKDGPIPKRCAKCKMYNWNRPGRIITPQENGLRRRKRGMKKLYIFAGNYWNNPSLKDCWNTNLVEKFLNLYPPPTIPELLRVANPSGLTIHLTSQNQYTSRGYFPDLQKPGWLIYDTKRYQKILKLDAQKYQDIMHQ
jgi:hypothetical protein